MTLTHAWESGNDKFVKKSDQFPSQKANDEFGAKMT